MRTLLLALIFSLATAGAAAAQTVILVRHAEKVDQSRDPLLSEAGQARAQALAVQIRDVRLTNILVTPFQRTRLTAQPAAAAFNLTPEEVSVEGGAAHIDRVVARIRSLPPDAVVLVVGHSNTVPAIGAALTRQPAVEMPDCEYDRMMVIESRSGTFVTTRYGARSACPAPAAAP